MDRAKFYAALRSRANTLFGTSLSQGQVNALDAMLDEASRRGLPLRHLAYVMATAYHEVGPALQPKRENLNYTSAARIRQVWPARFPTVASAQPYVRQPQKLANKVYGGRLGNVRSNDGWLYRGDGLVQLTGKANFDKFGVSPGMDLETAVHVMIDGMVAGKFTGKKLSDYINGSADYRNARRIINADVAANGAKIAGYAEAFERALSAAGYSASPAPSKPVPAPKPQPKPAPAPEPAGGFWAWLASIIRSIIRGGR